MVLCLLPMLTCLIFSYDSSSQRLSFVKVAVLGRDFTEQHEHM